MSVLRTNTAPHKLQLPQAATISSEMLVLLLYTRGQLHASGWWRLSTPWQPCFDRVVHVQDGRWFGLADGSHAFLIDVNKHTDSTSLTANISTRFCTSGAVLDLQPLNDPAPGLLVLTAAGLVKLAWSDVRDNEEPALTLALDGPRHFVGRNQIQTTAGVVTVDPTAWTVASVACAVENQWILDEPCRLTASLTASGLTYGLLVLPPVADLRNVFCLNHDRLRTPSFRRTRVLVAVDVCVVD